MTMATYTGRFAKSAASTGLARRQVQVFQSLRVFAFLAHLVSTSFLVWTRQDSVSVTVAPLDSAAYSSADAQYLAVIGAGLALLVLRLLLMPGVFTVLSLGSGLELILDSLAAFFVAWIVLDGLAWKTYLFIFGFCVVLPLLMNLFSYLRAGLRALTRRLTPERGSHQAS